MKQEPTTKPGGLNSTVSEHPAFAQISSSRVSSSGKVLYASDFAHDHYMVLRISTSKMHRNLSRDWHMEDRNVIEIALTESQWASFISSSNVGGGTPCTLERIQGTEIPQIAPPKPRKIQFTEEVDEALKGIIEKIDDLYAGAKTKTQANEIAQLRQQFTSNLPFLAKQFDLHAENTVEKAKMEVQGYVSSTLHRAGVAALTGEVSPPLHLEHDDGED